MKNKKQELVKYKEKKFDGEHENNLIKKKNYKFIKTIAWVGIIIMTIIIVACTIDIFNFFYNLHPYAGYSSLGLIVVLLLIFIVRPVALALSTPSFTLDVVDVENKRAVARQNYHKLKRVAKNLLKSEYVTDENKEKIENAYSNKKELNIVLKEVYDKDILKRINQIINETATKVLISTAISQNNRFDAATVIILNIRMIMRVVVTCGYHPSYPQLYRLIAKVFRNALIAYTLQALSVNETILEGINRLVKGALNAIPILTEITKSITQGAANALLTLRIGILTRKYLYEEFDIQAMIEDPDETKELILEEAVVEANSNIDSIINECKRSGTLKRA